MLLVSGPLDVISDFARALHRDHVIRAAQLRLIVAQIHETGHRAGRTHLPQIRRRWWLVPTTAERRMVEAENARAARDYPLLIGSY